MTGSGVISSRVARGSTLIERQPAVRLRRLCFSADERRKEETRRRQSAKLARHHHPQQGEYLGSVEAPDRERAEAIAIKQFALDDDQRNRLLIRERQ